MTAVGIGAVALALFQFNASANIAPVVTESGLISASFDAMGTTSTAGNIRVDKPFGATVRKAYLLAASTGFSSFTIPNGAVTLAGNPVNWSSVVNSAISSRNHFADVTAIVKPIIDPAPAGINTLVVNEGANTSSIDGEILAVIFDDPNQATANTVILLFGAQNIAGDTFNVTFANPINPADPNLALDMSLGISFGFQTSGQYSIVNVNGQRLTTSAGGQDDGQSSNGALITVGGIGDTDANPANPFQTDTGGPRYDDELYNLIPFITNGTTTITVFTQNPSSDDNILFAGFILKSVNAIIGGGIVLDPSVATNCVPAQHTLTATAINPNGSPAVGATVTFTVLSGPNSAVTGTGVTGSNGQTSFTYSGSLVGVDQIQACAVLNGSNVCSTVATKLWISCQTNNLPPVVCCTNVTVRAGSNCLAQASINCGSYDPEDGTNITVVQVPPGPYHLGSNSVCLIATDTQGATNVCCAVVTVVDDTPPAVNCPGDITATNSPGECFATVSFLASAFDACSLRSFSCDSPSGGTFPVGTTTVTCTAVDGSDNTNSCSFKVTVRDTEAPVLTNCPSNIEVCNDEGQCSAVVTYTPPTATDNCASGPAHVAVYSGFTDNGGGTPYTGLVGTFDAAGVSFGTDTGFDWHPFGLSTFGADITGCLNVAADGNYGFLLCSDDGALLYIDGNLVVDHGGPQSVSCASGSATLTAGTHTYEVQFFEDFGGPSGVDLVLDTGVSFATCNAPAVSCDPPSGSTFPVGNTTVCCTATDASGNTNSCCFNVTVKDCEPPVAACREGVNPSGKKIPVAGKNPSSGQNPDGFYQLLGKDNCDASPAIYLADTGSSFIAGPFANGDVIKLTQSPGRTPSQDPGPTPYVVAHVHLKGDGVVYAVDSAGNVSDRHLCLVPRPPK